jgi:hypothetical protein
VASVTLSAAEGSMPDCEEILRFALLSQDDDVFFITLAPLGDLKQIIPIGVYGFDQPIFSFSLPAFELSFARYSRIGVIGYFEID